MRGLLAALGGVLVCLLAALAGSGPAQAKETEEFNVGQWTGFSYTSNDTGQFTDCTVWAFNNSKIQVGISINKSWNLELWLNSDAWNLPANQTYPISYWIDRNPLYHGKAATSTPKFAEIDVERGQAVFDELRSGSQLTFRTQSDDYVFDLRGSNAALNRLLDCVDQYSKQASTNPFGGGANEQQSGGGQQGGFENSNQQQEPSGGGNQGDATSMKLKQLTQSSDDVRQFLVDVTGAKPSMITVNAKETKSGYPYYDFTTPIGAGQFWQERLGGESLHDVADFYLEDYKEECKGEFNQSIQDPVQGERGQALYGSATCSSSPYQEGGAEVISYALTVSGDVVSIYSTYVGGNAAKAKTDSLGKLVARRQESEIK